MQVQKTETENRSPKKKPDPPPPHFNISAEPLLNIVVFFNLELSVPVRVAPILTKLSLAEMQLSEN
jgi:hypothetical protein